ncbi:DUF2961 domain-containing protein [Treponema sp. OttesenSCG-928-L16]|nr:DUF2961 domain-containing protein [Treponema sp. OttesenSCG-928-L16]
MFGNPFSNSLSALPLMNSGRSRAINMENPAGEKGKGGMAEGILGPSRKGSPAIRGFKAGETRVLAEIDGPGVINHIWMTVPDKSEHDFFVLCDIVLRMYWDDEEEPSVECPLGDFFCNGFGTGCSINSLPIAVNPDRGFNSYFPMPFGKKARITVENQHAADVRAFFYQIDYCLYDSLPEETAYFHAQWRRERLTQLGKDYVILDGVRGRGHYVGTYMALTTLERYWWGEGEVKFFLDGDDLYPTICGTGLEDYFGGAWGFVEDQRRETPAREVLFQTPFLGFPFYAEREQNHSWRFEGSCPPMRGLYRWHIMDPVRFAEDLKVTVQQIGVCHKGLFERQDDVATVAYWYQSEPHGAFPLLPPKEYRWPR